MFAHGSPDRSSRPHSLPASTIHASGQINPLKGTTFVSEKCDASHLLTRESERKSIMVSSFLLPVDRKSKPAGSRRKVTPCSHLTIARHDTRSLPK